MYFFHNLKVYSAFSTAVSHQSDSDRAVFVVPRIRDFSAWKNTVILLKLDNYQRPDGYVDVPLLFLKGCVGGKKIR